jgi:hypothetical protein
MRTLSALILSIALIACEQGSMRPPEVLAREPFTAVLCDLQLVEARINHELVVEPIGTIPSDRYAEEVFARQRCHQGAVPDQFGLLRCPARGDDGHLRGCHHGTDQAQGPITYCGRSAALRKRATLSTASCTGRKRIPRALIRPAS